MIVGTRSIDVHLVLGQRRTSWGTVLRLVKASVRRPKTYEGVLVRLRITIPEAAFEPFTASAEVVVPGELIERTLDVEAVSP